MVLHTLEKTIGRCRAFHDLLKTLEPEKYKTEFLNIVSECSDDARQVFHYCLAFLLFNIV